MKTFPYAKQTIDEADLEAVQAVFKECMITRGPKMAAFEEAIASYCGARFAVTFNSGTSALHAAYFAAEAGPADRVITTPNTFVGTVVGAHALGARLCFSDINPTTGNLDLDKLPEIEPPTRGKLIYVPVHYAGAPLDMARLQRQIGDPKGVIIEDGAAAFGASYPDKTKVGSCQFSDLTIFSFHPSKTITTGEGGAVTTNSEQLYKRLLIFRNNGLGNSLSQALTGNFHMNELSAALGISQLAKVDKMVRRRRAAVRTYRKLLCDIPHLTLLPKESDLTSAHNLFVALIDFKAIGKSRDAVRQELEETGIDTQVHYAPLYRHPAIGGQSLEGMEAFNARALTLPLYPGLTEANLRLIAETLQTALSNPSSG
jgi:perosamine synthetase